MKFGQKSTIYIRTDSVWEMNIVLNIHVQPKTSCQLDENKLYVLDHGTQRISKQVWEFPKLVHLAIIVFRLD